MTKRICTTLGMTMLLATMMYAATFIGHASVDVSGSGAAGNSQIAVQINGETVEFTDAAPRVINGTTYLPIRAVGEKLGLEVYWNDKTGQVGLSSRTLSMKFKPSDDYLSIDYGMTTPDGNVVNTTVDNAKVRCYTINNRTYLPFRFIADKFGYTVGWERSSNTVVIIDTVKVIKEAMSSNTYEKLDPLYGNLWLSDANKMTIQADGKITVKASNKGQATSKITATHNWNVNSDGMETGAGGELKPYGDIRSFESMNDSQEKYKTLGLNPLKLMEDYTNNDGNVKYLKGGYSSKNEVYTWYQHWDSNKVNNNALCNNDWVEIVDDIHTVHGFAEEIRMADKQNRPFNTADLINTLGNFEMGSVDSTKAYTKFKEAVNMLAEALSDNEFGKLREIKLEENGVTASFVKLNNAVRLAKTVDKTTVTYEFGNQTFNVYFGIDQDGIRGDWTAKCKYENTKKDYNSNLPEGAYIVNEEEIFQ